MPVVPNARSSTTRRATPSPLRRGATAATAAVLMAAASLVALPTPVQAQAAPAAAVPMARVIVQWRDDAATAAATPDARGERAQRLAARAGIPGLAAGRALGERAQVLMVPGLTSEQLVARLARDPSVATVEVDRRMKRAQAVAPVNDPRFDTWPIARGGPVSGQWYLKAPSATTPASINAVGGWSFTTGNPRVVVAVLDTGIRSDHPELLPVGQGGNVLPGRDFIAADDVNPDSNGSVPAGGTVFGTAGDGNGRDSDASDPGDFLTQAEIDANPSVFKVPGEECLEEPTSSWHGTQVAGLIAAATNNGRGMASVARNVQILPVRVLGKCGGYTSDIIAGLRWAAGLPVPGEPSNPTPAWVLNLSLGGGIGSCDDSPSTKAAVADVTRAGAVVVVAAGNSEGQAVGRPANCPGAIAVGGVRHTGTKVGFSDLGREIALMAPGGNRGTDERGPYLYPILSATNAGQQRPIEGSEAYTDSFNFAVGTSFSSPLVAGAAALILSLRPDLRPEQVRQALTIGARSFPAPDPSVASCRAPDGITQFECNCNTALCGAGLLDVENAIRTAQALGNGGITTRPIPGSVVTPPTQPPTQPPADGGGGGGALGMGWLAALAVAAGLLAQRRRRVG